MKAGQTIHLSPAEHGWRKSPMLALLLSIAVEGAFAVGVTLFNRLTDVAPDQGLLNGLWRAFHWPAANFTDFCRMIIPIHHFWGDFIGMMIFFAVALFEWWVLFYLAIWSFHRWGKKPA